MPTIKGPLERDFLNNVLELANFLRWRRAHFRPAMTKWGWRTPVQADGRGFPDLILVRPPRLLVVELKSDKGTLSVFQEEWLLDFRGVPGVEVYVWKPVDWDKLGKILQ